MKKILLALLMAYNAANVHGMDEKKYRQETVVQVRNAVQKNSIKIGFFNKIFRKIKNFNNVYNIVSYVFDYNRLQIADLGCDDEAINDVMHDFTAMFSNLCAKKETSFFSPAIIENIAMKNNRFSISVSKFCYVNTNMPKISNGVTLLAENALLQMNEERQEISHATPMEQLYYLNINLHNFLMDTIGEIVSHGIKSQHKHFFYIDAPAANFARKVSDEISTVTAFLMPHYHVNPNEFHDAFALTLSIFGDVGYAIAYDAFHTNKRFEFDAPVDTLYQVSEFRQNITFILKNNVICWQKTKTTNVPATFETNIVRVIATKKEPTTNWYIKKIGKRRTGNESVKGIFVATNGIHELLVKEETANDFIVLGNSRNISIEEVLLNEFISMFPLIRV